MRQELIEKLKLEIKNNLSRYLQDEGIELYMAANDNIDKNNSHVVLKDIENKLLRGGKLLSEIRVILEILGKPWQCDLLVNGIYQTLQPASCHHL